jgi:thiamine kinase-like enzyme
VQHGDFRTDNLLFGARRGTVPVAVVDWQTVAVGSPLLDVAYFLVTSLDTADFAQHFEYLLDFYLSAMKESGTPLDNDVSRHEFVRYILQPVVMLVSAAVIVERTERGDRMFLTMIERAASAATLCQSVEALS